MKDLLTLIEDEQLALIAVFKNAVQQLYRIGRVFAEDFCHRIVMRPIFHHAPPVSLSVFPIFARRALA